VSKTAYYAAMVKDELERLQKSLKEQDPARNNIEYILYRLWPDLESAIKQELSEK
jgi:hypothetical protein